MHPTTLISYIRIPHYSCCILFDMGLPELNSASIDDVPLIHILALKGRFSSTQIAVKFLTSTESQWQLVLLISAFDYLPHNFSILLSIAFFSTTAAH